MASDHGSPSRAWLFVVPAVVVVAVLLALVAGRSGSSDGGDGPTAAGTAPMGTAPVPVDVRAEGAPSATSVAELVTSSDVVVQGRVVAVERGRAIGTTSKGIVTRLVQLRVDRVLAGDAGIVGADGSLIVEEEGWLPDGRPVRVNGVEPTREGDAGVWFLVKGRSEEFPYTAVVGEQGRYLLDPSDPSKFATTPSTDSLVRSVEAAGPAALAAQVAG